MATQPIKIAILAMGGEGGGVLANWLVDLGERNGHLAQATSVPGVAQRTGATIYYVELFPVAEAGREGLAPVLALMPLPGDVDIVLASELMEAARAVQRGLVTPDRTTLVASTHRVYAIAEKMVPGDGRADAAALRAAAEAAAKRFVGFDMAEAAEASGSVISAVLFGALAGTGVLPFARAQFEATIERGGVGVAASLAAFAAAFERAARPAPPMARPVAPADSAEVAEAVEEAEAAEAAEAVDAADAADAAAPPHSADRAVQDLIDRAVAGYAGSTRATVLDGLRRVVDYQDSAYGVAYLDRLAALPGGAAAGGRARDDALAREVARHLALWMAYEDTIRVADLKTRDARFERVRSEVRVVDGQLLDVDEFMHPRLQEIADTLPAAIGRRLLGSGAARSLVERLGARGRVVATRRIGGFLLLRAVAGLRRWRRGTLRFADENARIEAWLADIRRAAVRSPALAAEIARCQRVVKGYGDTHARGLANYASLRAAWQRAGDALAPAVLAELRDAALGDEQGRALHEALRRHALA